MAFLCRLLLSAGGFVACLVACPLFLHGSNGGIVQYLDGTAADGGLQVLLPEGLALHIEVGDVKLIFYPQFVPHYLLLVAFCM